MGGIIHGIIVAPPLLLWLLKNFFILRRPIKLSLDPLLGYQWEEHLYILNRQRNRNFWVVKKRCAHSKQLRSILHWLCWFKSSGSVVSRLVSSMTQAVTIFSIQSVISRVYTSRFGNGTVCLEPQPRWYWKKYQVPGTVPSGKPPKSEPYRTVPCRTMQWKSVIKEGMVHLQLSLQCTLYQFSFPQKRTDSACRACAYKLSTTKSLDKM